jgi:hypothetical protein
MSTTAWTIQLEQLLVTWAEKASGYAWLHQRSAILNKKKNLCISIPASLCGYIAGITILLSNEVFNDSTNTNGPMLRGVIGVAAITSGILSNFQEMFTFKEESEKHRIAVLRFLSFFREISCELSLDPKYRSGSIEYITLKRFEFDKILEQSPEIPENIIKQFNNKFKNVTIHKPDPTIGLQTIIPFGYKGDQFIPKNNIKDNIILLKYFTQWHECTIFRKQSHNDTHIEITNSRSMSSELDTSKIDTEFSRMGIVERNAYHLMIHGTLKEQKPYVQNQNIKIRCSPIIEESNETDDIIVN